MNSYLIYISGIVSGWGIYFLGLVMGWCGGIGAAI